MSKTDTKGVSLEVCIKQFPGEKKVICFVWPNYVDFSLMLQFNKTKCVTVFVVIAVSIIILL